MISIKTNQPFFHDVLEVMTVIMKKLGGSHTSCVPEFTNFIITVSVGHFFLLVGFLDTIERKRSRKWEAILSLASTTAGPMFGMTPQVGQGL